MTAELLELVALLLLALAIASGTVALIVVHRHWRLVVLGARLGALGLLLAALVVSVVTQDQWSPFDLHQLSISIAIASLAAGLVLFRAWDLPVPDPVLDLTVLAIVLVRLSVIRPGGPVLSCAQRDILFGAQWALFVLGAAGSIVAAATALGWVARSVPRLRALHWAAPGDLFRPLHAAVLVTLLSVGAGLLLGIVWAWRTYGTLAGGDPRQGWMASIWLWAAMSLVSWQLDRGNRWWASIFAGIAGAAVLFGLLAILDLQRLWGL
ncbi:MAG: hypothetical protein M8467_02905 [Anaerolineae bacterium]|nr:hypothetical protein [Anaerolineae bacterium]